MVSYWFKYGFMLVQIWIHDFKTGFSALFTSHLLPKRQVASAFGTQGAQSLLSKLHRWRPVKRRAGEMVKTCYEKFDASTCSTLDDVFV